MKFLSVSLVNYIGIYNGMGLNEIHLDFKKCKYNTIVIRGENGAGKSTVMKAISVLPDSNDMFIPNLPASKEVYLQDDTIIYHLVFLHGIKSNGERDITKAYIDKIFPNGSVVPLNENGNVTSYKDVLYVELRLDANFIALSQLSLMDRGLADKKPAERKKFVNSIISSLEVYNGIYKTLNKKSNVFKSMISSISGKLGTLGDEKLLKTNLDTLESTLLVLDKKKSTLSESVGNLKTLIIQADPNGTLQFDYKKNKLALSEEDNKIVGIMKSMTNISSKINIDIENNNYEKKIDDIRNKKNNINVDTQILKSKLSSIISDRETESKDILIKSQKLSSIMSESKLEDLQDELATYTTEADVIKSTFNAIGIKNILSITKDEYILALETLKNIKNSIDIFKDNTDYAIMVETVESYVRGMKYPDISSAELSYVNASDTVDGHLNMMESLQYKIEICEKLSIRPKECKIDGCGFIKDALEYEKEGVSQEYKRISKNLQELAMPEMERCKLEFLKSQKIAKCISDINVIVRDISIHSKILRKLPNGEIYGNPVEFFKRILEGSMFDEINVLYGYIDYANQLEVYNNYDKYIVQLEAQIAIQMNNREIADNLMKEIEDLNFKIINLDQEVQSINKNISENDYLSIKYSSLESDLRTLKELQSSLDESNTARDDHIKSIADIEGCMGSITDNLECITNTNKEIDSINNEIMIVRKDRDNIQHSLGKIKEYKEEYAELSQQYDFIETIRYYSSPTSGIQLVFMNLYMSKILTMANELLSLLFNGRFVIQPFIIDETEFKIPVQSLGILNDDITSMSSGEIAMISLVISFALLYHSGTRYNILKLDEIDATLDTGNRSMFIDVLYRIMNIMNVEQCIMISHNSEMEVNSSDVILLRMDSSSAMDYSNCNIIWNYNSL